MTAIELIKELEKRGCRLEVVDGVRLKVKGALTDELRELIREHKQALLAELQTSATVAEVAHAEVAQEAHTEPLDYRREGAKARELLDKRGWCAVESRTLGEVVIWTRDGKVAVPERWKDAVRYTALELAALAAEPRVTPEGLRRIHEAKRVFGGTVQAITGEARPGSAGLGRTGAASNSGCTAG